ncbi:Arginine/ornithine antiporter ArcD [Serinicoccus hydrothermalis]|uniref:Arginine/ornithine antiporter ArcD n=1 Tax=Serinicoccus hydrothermalis TaxID=1758689 RepID=A0A1B1NGP2_9MICO|nr:Arginine/ornithine antiporter ArcD [Serinicoccus hydrothermalis]
MVATRRTFLQAAALVPPLTAISAAPALAASVQTYLSLRRHYTPAHFESASRSAVVVENRSGRAHVRLASSGLQSGRNPELYGTSATYYYGRLTSPQITPAQPFDRLIASWNALTPVGTWVQVEVRAYRPSTSRWTKYFNMGIWTETNATIGRRSVAGQGNADGTVETDLLKLAGGAAYTRFQYRLTLFTTDRTRNPSVSMVAVLASNSAKEAAGLPVYSDRQAWGRDLNVPKRSQMIYPDGGEVWCSPTSTSMVLAYWGKNVTVPRAAARTYDYTYRGHGNWPFNTAWASTQGLDAYVTRMGSLAQLEEWISAGVPVVISIAWKRGELTGAPIPSSNGHVIVVRGFDSNGDVIVNDPAASSDARVRLVYRRLELFTVWLKYSGGTAYLIHPRDHAVPTDKRHGSW